MLPRPEGTGADQRVQLPVDQQDVDAAGEFAVGAAGADVLHHFAEVGGGVHLRIVDEFRPSAGEPDAGLVQPFDDPVDAFAVAGVAEAVVFGGNQQQAGAVVVFQRFDLNRAVGDFGPLDHREQITAERVRFGVFKHVSLGQHVGVGVVADEMDCADGILDVESELRLDGGAAVSAGGGGVVLLQHAGNRLRGQVDVIVFAGSRAEYGGQSGQCGNKVFVHV
ncbi:hypothetical protein SDC9_175152 [bioreactor metagenome]|uniref:Uncharacterized protein n=1 Tax=bioreactor metagenome TaxID=1076179 RepID=A0A645GLC1_9ZZZZ